ncbi:MAG: CinA family nicotinamide mononucleotide deamidase-related protein [Anaerolineae bacterium]|nr:CinA family nicotinamide mononucleotide deamidase-related protein [Anaerolineae bacterium]
MNAEIVATGTELLLGELVDTNSAYIARHLREIGVNVYFKTTVGDNLERITRVLNIALSRADVVITTGGLGPTVDDVTREAVARATERPLELDERQLGRIEAMFTRWGRQMGANNRRQAYLPHGSIPIDNPVGTAPGSIVESPRGTIISIPGVPHEMEYLMEHAVLPYLRSRLEKPEVIVAKVLRTVGIGESSIDEQLDDLMRLSNPTVGLAAHSGQTDVRITAKADSEAVAQTMIAEIEAQVRARLGEYVYGEGHDTVEEVTARLLAGRGWRLAFVEGNTRGAVARRLTATPDGEKVVASAMVLDDEAKLLNALGLELSGTQNGRFTPDDAQAVALALRRQTGADLALAILGSLAAEDGVYGKEQGETHAALAASDSVEHRAYPFGGTDELTQRWIGNRVIDWLRHKALA